MAGAETSAVHLCMMQASRCGVVLFKNVRGFFLTLDGARKIKAGLQADGSSDLIGWKTITVTPEMVGSKIAVFVAAEVKTTTGAVRPEQRKFIEAVNKSGGIAGVVRCENDMKKLID